MLQVGVFEEGGVFEAVAEETVEGYVGDPDEGDGELPMEKIADEQESEWECEGVDEVVEGGSELRVEEVAEHGEVGYEQEDGEDEPAAVQVLPGEEGEGEKESFFEVEEAGRAGQHGSFYWSG